MAIQKYRSGEEMNATPVTATRPGDFDRFLRHCARVRAFWPKTYPHGVFKFRTAAEADAARTHHDLSTQARSRPE